jgi:anti-anti-sigma regulatory factor
MLRISTKREENKTKILYLEGKICQPWMKELISEIQRGIDDGENIVLDLSKVSFLAEDSAEIIRQFSEQRVEIKNGSLFIRSLLGIDK